MLTSGRPELVGPAALSRLRGDRNSRRLDDEDRALRARDEIPRDASKQRGADGTASTGADDDEIGLLLVGDREDPVNGGSRDPLERVADAGGLRRLRSLFERRLRLVDRLVVLKRNRGPRRPVYMYSSAGTT